MKGMIRELFHFSGVRGRSCLIAPDVRLVGFGPYWQEIYGEVSIITNQSLREETNTAQLSNPD
jgi:hypothetical protein